MAINLEKIREAHRTGNIEPHHVGDLLNEVDRLGQFALDLQGELRRADRRVADEYWRGAANAEAKASAEMLQLRAELRRLRGGV